MSADNSGGAPVFTEGRIIDTSRIVDIRQVKVRLDMYTYDNPILQVKFHGDDKWTNVRTETLHENEYKSETHLD